MNFRIFSKPIARPPVMFPKTIHQVREENPDMKITEISKVLGARWREMDDAQKKPFQKKADADKERWVIRHEYASVLWDV